MGGEHNAIDYGPEIGRSLGRFVGIGSLEEGVARLGETLTPTIDAFGLPELAFLRNETLCAREVQQAGVALELSGIALANPTGSNRIVVVEGITCATSAATGQIFELYMHTDAAIAVELGASGFGFRRDRRGPGAPTVSSAIIRQGTEVAVSVGQAIELMGIPTIESIECQSPPLVLPPGQACAVWTSSANVVLFASFKWRERPARPGELP